MMKIPLKLSTANIPAMGMRFPSPPSGQVRVAVQCLQPLTTYKIAVTSLIALLVSLLTIPLQAAPNDDFGRLFSRPSERKSLDIMRQNQKLKVITQQDLQRESSTENEPVELPEPVTLQGYVKRSDGSTTLWVNSKPVQENSAVDDVEIGHLTKQQGVVKNSSDSLNVKIPATGKRIRLKAGQIYEPETNQIKELRQLEKEKQLRLEETGVVGSDE